jgi:hypothetical protein
MGDALCSAADLSSRVRLDNEQPMKQMRILNLRAELPFCLTHFRAGR